MKKIKLFYRKHTNSRNNPVGKRFMNDLLRIYSKGFRSLQAVEIILT